LLVWLRDELVFNGVSCESDFACNLVGLPPRLSLTNSSKLDISILTAGSPMKLDEEPPPPETAQPPAQPPFTSGREMKTDEMTTRNKIVCLILIPMAFTIRRLLLKALRLPACLVQAL